MYWTGAAGHENKLRGMLRIASGIGLRDDAPERTTDDDGLLDSQCLTERGHVICPLPHCPEHRITRITASATTVIVENDLRDIGYNFFDPTLEPVGTCVLVCINPDGQARGVADTLRFPNGMVITPDGKTLIVGETMGHRLTAFDVQADGSLANRRVFAQLPEDVSTDDIALDAEGALWLANPEGRFGALRVREGGEIVERVELDTEGYAVMLGGPEVRHLFICCSGSHDPVEIARTPSATRRVVEVDVPGAGKP